MFKALKRSSFTVVCALAVAASVPARADLVGFYQFDDSSDLGKDSSSLHNDLIAFGSGVAYTSAGAFGGGLSLSGDGGLTTINGDVPNLFPLNDDSYTISVAFETTDDGFLGMIGWGNYGNTDQVMALRTDSTGVWHYWWDNDLGSSAINVIDGAFHTMTVTYDGTIRSVYVDGTLLGQDFPGVHDLQDGNFAIGQTCPFCGDGEFFNGTLDNVAVFNEALDAGQVASITSGDFSPFLTPEPASFSLVGIALVGLAALRRRKRA